MPTTSPPRRGRRRDERKTRAILAAASDLFLAQGLQQTSMDAIAARAGVSKQTLYTHFRNKDDLFRTVIRCKVAEHQLGAGASSGPLPPPETTLRRLGTELLSLILDPEVVAMFRVVIAEAAAYPRVAQLFYEAGPRQAAETMAEQIGAQMNAGALRPGDPHAAAHTFASLCKGELHMEAMLGLPMDDREARIEAQVAAASHAFLVLYR